MVYLANTYEPTGKTVISCGLVAIRAASIVRKAVCAWAIKVSWMLYISQITFDAEISISGNCGNGESIPESRLIWLPNNKLAGEAFVLLRIEEFKMRCINGEQFLYWYTSFVSYRNDRKYRLISLLTRSTIAFSCLEYAKRN